MHVRISRVERGQEEMTDRRDEKVPGTDKAECSGGREASDCQKEQEEHALWEERWRLCRDRLGRIPGEHLGEPEFEAYFAQMARFWLQMSETYRFVEGGGFERASLSELQERNRALYEDVLPGRYEQSYADPACAVRRLGETFGPMLSFLYAELRSLIGFVHEERLDDLVIRGELLAEVYTAFVYGLAEDGCLPQQEEIRQILYWFVSDYADEAAKRRIRELVSPEDSFAVRILEESDLSDPRFLYRYGEYVGENELATAEFLAQLPLDTVRLMADTYTEGYRIGFAVTGRDLSKKRTVELRYRLGFERMMRLAVENFAKMGLRPTAHRAAASILYDPSLVKNGYFGGSANRQYEFDHKDDRALFLDRQLVNRRLEVTRTAFEAYRIQAAGYAGPAVVETFGESRFDPVNKPQSLSLRDGQSRLWVEYRSRAGELQREYIPEEERSFTIIAFPVPEIFPGDRERYGAFFREVVRINTLDYQKYRRIQQTLIDALDGSVRCEIRGRGGNRTDLRVSICPLRDPEKETAFENCVADVNIPVGEVFTSPVLAGTEGVLHVSRVYLNGLEYRDLELTFAEGRVTDYTCGNFEREEENRAFVRENVLFRHDTLPMGEFAIGTNTTAYVTAKEYGVEDRLPILIAEKMGPHFAVGDTCYAHAEEIRVFNPDGREIIARENELTRQRDTAPDKAYFHCHTDITIPYDELGELNAVRPDGEVIPLIRDGRFVLPGTEELNVPMEKRKNL